ncbi:TIGR01777 family oxidoreductase [Pseudarthrobacter sp. H3Y2-7]|uniref:TIGR01777 family oxidoreductase n=1 Tax=Pseudarthrobacter naphthalenicus TaxID=3031328 RepID=UPI0023AFD41D|nr:TIGR01777 family oxidoreductase [Pseudarthrobacter sp. H3Y2-7]MDE8669317.1 TIGR01777 family oxidoreductase [Pseudarthrobacter sp. H3Y2-7]
MIKTQTVVLAGASGFIGRYLRARFERDGWAVRTIGRRVTTGTATSAGWNGDGAIARVLDGTDLLVNLAGRSVHCRYNARNKAAILDSRVATTAALGRALARCQAPPSCWLNASTGTIYRHADDRPQAEADGELGSGFSVDVARAWEAALAAADTPGTRKIPLRIAIVLGPGGGALRPFATLARLGLGGHMGPGGQKFSWIHVEDLYRAVRFLHARTDISGPVNAASPDVVGNRELMRLVRRAYGARLGIPTPEWLLRLGAVLIRTETELVLKSRWVQPQKLIDAGFIFRQPELGRALLSITKGRP